MIDLQLGAVESKFADMIWENEPITASALAKLAQKELTWKTTTAYTVLKRLCQKGIFINDGGSVTSLISRGDFYSAHSQKYVEDTFSGSLPAFLSAFGSHKKLTQEEAEELIRFVDEHREGSV